MVRCLVVVLSGFCVFACSTDEAVDTGEGIAESQLVTSSKLFYEGSCAFLKSCSAPSKQADKVLWGCTDAIWPLGQPPLPSQTTCSSSLLYVAAPKNTSDDFCGLPVKLCDSQNKCLTVKPIEKSFDSRNIWEGGPAVMDYFGMKYSENIHTCKGAAELDVKVTTGTWDAYTFKELAAGSSHQFTFAPGRAGDNALEFLNGSAVTSGGVLEFCWASDSSSTWSCWTTDTVTNQRQRRILWSGSADVRYRLTFKAGTKTTFYWRKYTAP